MSALDQWGVDIFSLDSIANGHSIVAVTYTVLKVRTNAYLYTYIQVVLTGAITSAQNGYLFYRLLRSLVEHSVRSSVRSTPQPKP